MRSAREVSTRRVPVPALFGVSAVFHYLGPALAVLLFAHLGALGVAWLRIAGAAVVFAAWRRPWRLVRRPRPGGAGTRRWVLVALGVVLALMNSCFYLAIARLPLSTVGAVEFLGVVILAAVGVRSRRNLLALLLATAGVLTLTDIRLAAQPLGLAFAFANCGLFMLYVVLGHRVANTGAAGTGSGIDALAAAMVVAAAVATPFGVAPAGPAFSHIGLLLAGLGVGVCSSVIPYVTDQLVMARVPRATFALMLTVLPASATVIGVVVLHQVPTVPELLGIALVAAGVAAHQPAG
ncbi:MAG: EamA family transporter [Micromonosporaceae bacterium]|nr:EamA family transporter [Micromonosporaceae bacterium]